MAAIQPVSNDAACFERRLKAEFRQSIERFMVVGIARKCQRRTLGLRLLFEQPSVVMLHLVQMIEKHGRKCISVLKSEKARKTLELCAIRRQALRLLVIHHLQAMFDNAQESVGSLHGVARLDVDPFVRTKLVERCQGVAVAKIRIAAARDQLLRLCKKLNLTDATPTELDVVPLDRNFTMTAIGVDLPLHGVNVGKRAEVEVFSPHKRCQFVKDFFASPNISSARARLYHGGAFPVLSNTLVV